MFVAESTNFDRVASTYDSTRAIHAAELAGTTDLLSEVFGSGDEPLLEIGVGTGALALPMVVRGAKVIGLDLSAAMLERLVDKAGGTGGPTLARADATTLPFGTRGSKLAPE